MSDFSEHLAWIDAQHDRMIHMVKAWSLVNSGSHNLAGLENMGELALAAFAALDTEHEVIETKAGEHVNASGDVESISFGPVYHFKKRPAANRKVLLTGHLDTVFPKTHPFTSTRYLDDNTLNGPGVADMKGGIIVMLVALEALERSPYADSLGYEVILNCDEEIGSFGSAPILAQRAKAADFGMTFEPALPDGTLAGRRKGSGNFTLVVRGLAAHAGREFEKGVNAVHALSHFITELHALNGKKKGVTINPAIIEGGTATNIVPDLAILRFNVRVEDEAQEKWFKDSYKKIIGKFKEVKGLTIESHGHFNRPPKKLTPANEKLFEILKRCGKDIGVDVAWQATGGCCDGNNLAAVGLPNIDTLGVRGGKIHTEHEFALLDSFTERAKLSALLLLNYAAGNFEIN